MTTYQATANGARADNRRISRLIHAGDIGLILLLVAILALIILPLPVFLLDLLIGVNIALSVMLLMLAMYVPTTLSLSTFPSLLLFTTMLRIALQIAATKQILLTGQAGHIIETFGRLVVGGNVLIGFVVFLVIAIVQFIVVAKGSERVAEVGARFTLDAMPGKQMSIDADLRAGNLTKEDARLRRRDLEKGAQFHGAMDGAMKFVKNDAICGLIIAFVNIVAGVAVGALYHDMTAGDALNRYTLLTVGEGLVSQLPSLFVSIAAGVLVTRETNTESGNSNLGRDIGKQFLSQPAALMFTGVIVLAFLAIPGFPKFQFALLGATAIALSVLLKRHLSKPEFAEQTPMQSMRREGQTASPQLIQDADNAMVSPITVQFGPEAVEIVDPAVLDAAITEVRHNIRRTLGLPFPGVRSVRNNELEAGTFRLLVHELPIYTGSLRRGQVRVEAVQAQAATALLPAGAAQPDGTAVWVASEHASLLRQQSIASLGNERVVAAAIQAALTDHSENFIGIQETQHLMNEAENLYPELTQEVLRALPLQRIAETLRRLLQEQVSVRNLREILESMVTWGPREKDIVMLVEYVRVDLGRFTAHRLSGGSGRIRVILLDPQVEQLIRDAIQPGNGNSFIVMEPEQVSMMAGLIERSIAQAHDKGALPVIAASIDIRRYVMRMLDPKSQRVPVISFQEVGNHALLEPVARVSLPEPSEEFA